MENVFLIIARLFLASMATFGLWSAYKLSQICICRKGGVRLAAYIKCEEEAERLENTLFEADNSSFFGSQPRYAVLLDEEDLLPLLESSLTNETRGRVDIYIRADRFLQYFGKEDSRP